ncbi:hypothetical protein CSB09_04565 [Candidatus Gracilibacteria bacterium]|nr:MAG: hypothetical protein CSB09_04565 [Candidatus Gracilibacteria bacterium]
MKNSSCSVRLGETTKENEIKDAKKYYLSLYRNGEQEIKRGDYEQFIEFLQKRRYIRFNIHALLNSHKIQSEKAVQFTKDKLNQLGVPVGFVETENGIFVFGISSSQMQVCVNACKQYLARESAQGAEQLMQKIQLLKQSKK